ncbi:MAG: carboxylate/amino acid/amine transporter [Pseudohongiellaceae bacterium]
MGLAALCWGLAGGIGGLLISHGWDPLLIAFSRGATGLLCVTAWLTVRRGDSGLKDYRLWAWSSLAGLGVAGNFGFYFISIEYGSVAVAATLMYCAPLFVYLVSFVAGLEKPTAAKLSALPIVVLGIVLLTQVDDIGAHSVSAASVGSGLLSGLSYAIFIFSFKSAAYRGSPQAILVIAFAALSMVTFAALWPDGSDQVVRAASSADWPWFATLGILGAGLSFVLYVAGLNHTSPAMASVIAMLEPVTATLFAILVLNEGLDMSQIIGMSLILLAVTALSSYSASAKPDTRQKDPASHTRRCPAHRRYHWAHQSH